MSQHGFYVNVMHTRIYYNYQKYGAFYTGSYYPGIQLFKPRAYFTIFQANISRSYKINDLR